MRILSRNYFLRKLIAGVLLSATCFFSYGERTEKTINDAWEFRMPSSEAWEKINIPHTFNLDAYSRRDYYKGKGHYRRKIRVGRIEPEKRYFLKFDAASKAAEVTVNGSHVVSHAGGYSAFTADISPYLNDGTNILEVCVDNDRNDITPVSADFTFWGGIYRDVWLVTLPQVHFCMSDYGSDGVYISTPAVNEKEGVFAIKEKISNDSEVEKRIRVVNLIYAPSGELVETITRETKVKGGETVTVECRSKGIGNPVLWSPDSPSLYRIKTRLCDARSGEVLDERHHRAAFRWFSFDGNEGFMLNGKKLKLRGVNRHQDQWPVGVAMEDEAHRRDVALMKDMGCNFIRISHYPQDDALLDACDEMGLLVWEEIPIVNMVPATAGYEDCCEENLKEMVRQHYNHPSVIAWGYMNEILLTTPGPSHKDWPVFRDRTVNLARRLESVLKREDPSRASVMAFNMTNLYNEIGLDLEDVAGWNLYHGWYVGELREFNEWCENQHANYPDHPIIISEWGAGSDRRLHSDVPRPFDFSIEYHQKYVEHYLPYIEEKEWIAGCAYWNFIDFNVAARQESMPRVNNKGLFYNDRTPKDIAYFFKAMWRPDTPVVRIASRDRAQRWEKPDGLQGIKVYSNMPELKLYVNGKYVSTAKPEKCIAVFNVSLPSGESVISVTGNDGDRTAGDAMVIDYRHFPDISEDEFAVNVGSDCYFTSSVSGLTWFPDRAYTSDSWGAISGTDKSTTSEIFETVDGPVYQTWKEGDVAYRFDVRPGEYEVELLMADLSRPARQQANLLGKSDGEKKTGAARFDIEICGKRVEENFAPSDDSRHRVACRKRYIVTDVSDGLHINLIPIEGNPSLAGIKIRRM